MNKQFELLELKKNAVYVDLQYDDISLIFNAGSVFLCCVCSRLWSVCKVVFFVYPAITVFLMYFIVC